MAGNFLEQLIAEWYEYRGYFIRRNVLVAPRAEGGYAAELDVVAFHPASRHLVHVEATTDASSWSDREARFARKFELGRRYIPGLFAGLEIPSEIEQIAVFVFASKKNRSVIGGGTILLASELLVDICSALAETKLASGIVPEQFSLLRTLQFVAQHRSVVWQALTSSEPVKRKGKRLPPNPGPQPDVTAGAVPRG